MGLMGVIGPTGCILVPGAQELIIHGLIELFQYNFMVWKDFQEKGNLLLLILSILQINN